ncbi:unnamed protein product [Lampetra planeri]
MTSSPSTLLFLLGSLVFGIITCVTGVLGVVSGVQASRLLRTRTPRADPLVCAAGLLLSSPFLYLAIVFAQVNTIATYVFIFLGETFLSMNWAIVADILLLSDSLSERDSFLWRFRSLQLALLLCAFVAVVGGAFFLATAIFVERDRHRAENFTPTGEIQLMTHDAVLSSDFLCLRRSRVQLILGPLRCCLSPLCFVFRGRSASRVQTDDTQRNEKHQLEKKVSSLRHDGISDCRHLNSPQTPELTTSSTVSSLTMNVSWSLLVLAAAVCACAVVLAITCLDCRNKGPQDTGHDYENVVTEDQRTDYLNVELQSFSTGDTSNEKEDDEEEEDEEQNYVNQPPALNQ